MGYCRYRKNHTQVYVLQLAFNLSESTQREMVEMTRCFKCRRVWLPVPFRLYFLPSKYSSVPLEY